MKLVTERNSGFYSDGYVNYNLLLQCYSHCIVLNNCFFLQFCLPLLRLCSLIAEANILIQMQVNYPTQITTAAALPVLTRPANDVKRSRAKLAMEFISLVDSDEHTPSPQYVALYSFSIDVFR
jgi:hypothetical protein